MSKPTLFPIVVLLYLPVISAPVSAGLNVAVVDGYFPKPPSQTIGELWCDLLVADGNTCTLFPISGPTMPLIGFDTVVVLSPLWIDPNAELQSFLQAGKTVVTWGGVPETLGIESNPNVRDWIGADSLEFDGFDGLRTVVGDPILGSITVGTDLEYCGDMGCPVLHGEHTTGAARVLARYGNGTSGVGVLRNIWMGGVSVYLSGQINPGSGNPLHQTIIVTSAKARALSVPAISRWGALLVASGLIGGGILVLLRRPAPSGRGRFALRRTPKSACTILLIAVWNGDTAVFALDVVTAESEGRTMLRLSESGDPVHVTDSEVDDLRSFHVPNSPIDLILWNERAAGGYSLPWFAIVRDGSQVEQIRSISYTIKTRLGEFDPDDPLPPFPLFLTSRPGNDLWLVQIFVPPTEEIFKDIQQEGGRANRFLPDTSLIVKASATSAATIGSLPFIRAVIPFHPAFRVEKQLLDELSNELGLSQVRRYSVMATENGHGSLQAIRREVEVIGGCVLTNELNGNRVEVGLNGAQLIELLHSPDVLFVDAPGETGEDLDVARDLCGANWVQGHAGFLGEGGCGEVMDGGVRATHVAFQHDGGVHLHGGNTGNTDHGTRSYGTIFGDGTVDFVGTVNPLRRGILPRGTGILAPTYSFVEEPANPCAAPTTNESRYVHTGELTSAPYFAVFQSNSWGHAHGTNYSTLSAEMDLIVFDTDLLICQSQGNAASQLSRPEAWAKNLVSVGGLRHGDSMDSADDTYCSSAFVCGNGTTCASTGPAPSQRIKPDLIGLADCIFTPHNFSDIAYTPVNDQFRGTSAATPITWGYFGLLFQMWHEQVFPGFGGGASVFSDRPHAATAKAILINTAYRYPLFDEWGGGPDFTRYNQGWGIVDIAALYQIRSNIFIVNESDLLVMYGTKSYNFTVASGDPALRATLVYTDPPGSPCSINPTVNDLSLKVVSPSGAVYWGNHRLNTSNWSTPDATPGTRTNGVEWDPFNTVENVFVKDPQPGSWTVTVIADLIVQDGHVETPETDADFALVVSSAPRPRGQCCRDEGASCEFTASDECAGAGDYWFSEHTCADFCIIDPAPNIVVPDDK